MANKRIRLLLVIALVLHVVVAKKDERELEENNEDDEDGDQHDDDHDDEHDENHNEQDEHDQKHQEPSEAERQAQMRQRVVDAKRQVKEELKWKDTDPIEVFNAEFLLAAWVLDHAPWNAYHSGLAFSNNRTGHKALFDFSPDNTSSVMRMIMPEVDLKAEGAEGMFKAAVLGEVGLTWRDGAHMEFHTDWPSHYTTFTRVGRLNGSIFFKFTDWVNEFYTPRYTAFNPVEIVVPSTDGKSGSTYLRSRMCHDFVTDSLWKLYEEGAKLKAEGTIFRDHILMYAESAKQVDTPDESRFTSRSMLRYLRTLLMYIDQIKKQFTHARTALQCVWKLGLPAYLHDAHGNYHQVKLTPPFLNYCYLPLAIPPAVYEPFGTTKLCALGMEANSTNVTSPSPMGYLLAVEERVDRWEVLAALVLTIVLVACASGPSASTPDL